MIMSGRGTICQSDIKSMEIVFRLNTGCSLFIDSDSFKLYNIKLTYLSIVYSLKYQCASLAKEYIVWMSTESRYILLSELKIKANI